jgi:AraC-like DNA-binding protein
MPPKRTESSRNSAHQERRLLLAIQAIKNKEISSLRDAARRFNVPEPTLCRRLRGTTSRAESRANSYKLTQIEEELLLKRIISIDDRGGAPRPSIVR